MKVHANCPTCRCAESVTLAEAIAHYLRERLQEARGSAKLAAHLTGVHVATFYRLCRRHQIEIQLAKRGHRQWPPSSRLSAAPGVSP